MYHHRQTSTVYYECPQQQTTTYLQLIYTILQQAPKLYTTLPRIQMCSKTTEDHVLNSLASNLGPLLTAGEVQLEVRLIRTRSSAPA